VEVVDLAPGHLDLLQQVQLHVVLELPLLVVVLEILLLGLQKVVLPGPGLEETALRPP
jgi:hypothetical protein